MLKRCQILLETWQLEYLKLFSERIDFSLSEMVRLSVCGDLLRLLPIVFPDCEIDVISEKDVLKLTKEYANPDTPEERRHQIASKLYFEARKAFECIEKKLK